MAVYKYIANLCNFGWSSQSIYAINGCLINLIFRLLLLFIFLQVQFKMGRNQGQMADVNIPATDGRKSKKPARVINTQCFSLYSLLLALNITTVDYLSLDIEGAELDILKTIPFNKVNIRVLTVEYNHVAAGKKDVQSFMEAQGYKTVTSVTHPWNLANDLVFVSKNG